MTLAREFALEATRKYLQNVVFVDDKIYHEVPVKSVTVQVPSPQSMSVLKPAVPKVAVETVVEADQNDGIVPAPLTEVDQVYKPKDLVESFALEGMVCALYQPDEGFATDSASALFRLCDRADAIILDWDFYKQPGTQILPLVANLVSKAQTTVPHHVRLCSIYTSTADLKKVAAQVYENLKNLGLEVQAQGDYNLSAGSTRIIVLGKPHALGRPADQKVAEVEEGKLAQRIIEEFAAMHEGILPSLALHGLASVRTSTKRVLDKFKRELDGAFLVHRGLIRPGDDAFDQVPELLAEETLAVMLDSQVASETVTALAEEAIDALGIKNGLPLLKDSPKTAAELTVAMLKKGATKVTQVDLAPSGLAALHTEIDAYDGQSKERLAALYTSRTQYSADRLLGFGTIVRRQSEDQAFEYLICLMPLCDCIRLTAGKEYRFPFWRLRKELPAGASKGLVVQLPEGEGFMELFSMGKPRDHMEILGFTASPQKVVLAEQDGNAFRFDGATPVEWVAQLKPSHAQRIAHDIAASFSRVGVLEAEWLRLKSSG